MARSHRSLLLMVLISAIASPAEDAAASEPVDYGSQVKPILKARCYACHGGLKQKAGLRLDTGRSIRRGGDGGPAVMPGHADESPIIERVTSSDSEHRMPPEGQPLTDAQVSLLRSWIDQGATSPEGERPEADPRQHWAFVPPVRPAVPTPRNDAGVRDPIDAFLGRERERRGLTPLREAEPNVLLRRVYLDLIGLPPTREELHAFLADPSPSSYERVVDRLLASPQYGERWARHWMDVWRYSDWYGRRAVPDVLNSYGQIWRWRDWIVRSLNEDKPYDRMVREMLAADEIAPADDANIVATGFLVRNFYRWNYNSWMKDNVEHTGKAFLGLTFNCAHCHDHKYDPIRHEDYFAFRAFFEPMELRHDRVPGEPDPGPYPKYDYGKAYAPIISGLVRVFDEKPDAKTFLYTRGESRNIIPGRPPIPPGMPEFLGGRSLRVEPIDLPSEVSYPGLKAFVRREEIAGRESAVAAAERELAESRRSADGAERALSAAEARWAPGNPRAFADPRMTILAFPVGGSGSMEIKRSVAAVEAARLTLRVDEAKQIAALSELTALRDRIAADDARYGRSSGDVATLSRRAARAERRASCDRAAVELARAEQVLDAARRKPLAEAAKAESAHAAALKVHQAALAALDRDATDYAALSPAYPAKSTGRRAALARWIAARSNPLTARVAVNHIWRWHFGTPLVATTDNFGRNGAPPTHPELLDWLAVELMEPTACGAAPWSFKALHRRIVTSAAYRMSSHPAGADHPGRAIDPANRSYWHFPASRMEAEELRDSLLRAAGALDPTPGGPDIDHALGLTTRRRSLYFTHHGESRMPFLELYDAPDACDAYRRTTTVVPQQALALVNNELLLDLSRELAARLWTETAAGDERCRIDAFVMAAFEQLLSRSPSPRERALAAEFLARQTALLRGGAGRTPLAPGPDADPRARARGDLIHALFSHNDFITIH